MGMWAPFLDPSFQKNYVLKKTEEVHMLTDKEIKSMLIDYFSIKYRKLPDITKELQAKNKELDEILESLALTSQKISDMPHGNNVTDPVSKIYEEYEKIKGQYADNAKYIREKLEEYNKKITIYELWIQESKLTDNEQMILQYMYKDGLRDWKIAQLMSYDSRSIWRLRKKAFEKMSVKCQ